MFVFSLIVQSCREAEFLLCIIFIPKIIFQDVLVKQCIDIQKEVKSLSSLKQSGFTAFELSQIILKLLTLLSATVTISHNDKRSRNTTAENSDEGEGAVSTIAGKKVLHRQESVGKHENIDWGKREDEQGRSGISENNHEANEVTSSSKCYRAPHVQSLQFDNVGYILGGKFSEEQINQSMLTTLTDGTRVIDVAECGRQGSIHCNSDGHDIIARRHESYHIDTTFALPPQAREVLLSVVVQLLNMKKDLEPVSNSTRYHRTRIKKQREDEDNNWWFSSLLGGPSSNRHMSEWMLILNWQPLLRLLMRTTPFLQINNTEVIRMNFLRNQTPIEKRTVRLITGSRKFFDQSIRPNGWTGNKAVIDCTARELWHYVKTDLKPETHHNSYLRALILLYLLHPSECSRSFYIKHMPRWEDRWRGVNQTPEIDFLWVVMFTRARKRVKENDYDWVRIKMHLEHVGPLLEENRWDAPVRRMSTQSSVMHLPPGLFNNLNDEASQELILDDFDLDEDEDNALETADIRATFIREYNIQEAREKPLVHPISE